MGKAVLGGGCRRDFEQLVEMCRQQGWRVVRAKKGWKCFPPDPTKRAITVHLSARELRSYVNLRAELRRAGLDVPH